MMKIGTTLALWICLIFLGQSGWADATDDSRERPNIVTIFIDDMGYRDLSCFGGEAVQTQHLDSLSQEGIRFKQFYVNSPICSPSRVALTTGQYPQRWRIGSFLNHRQSNRKRGMANWLDPQAPVLARQLNKVGYATGHFGKWHMGGQRDVGEAPLITEYGFDRSLTNFEGLGPRVLGLKNFYDGTKPALHHLGSDKLGRGEIRILDRSVITSAFVDAAVGFIDEAVRESKPFYVNVWPDDVHSPFFPPEVMRDETDRSKRALYQAVLDAMDEQLAPLISRIRGDAKLRRNTLIFVCSDNGHDVGAGRSDPLRGGKTWLYEAGIRSPLIVWGPGWLDPSQAGEVNDSAIFSAMDLNRSLYSLTGAPMPNGVTLDGENVADTLMGRSRDGRQSPIFFRRPPDRPGFSHGFDEDNPDLAMRSGKWKFLMNFGGQDPQLYDLESDIGETTNLAQSHPKLVRQFQDAVAAWNASLPMDASDPSFEVSQTNSGASPTN